MVVVNEDCLKSVVSSDLGILRALVGQSYFQNYINKCSWKRLVLVESLITEQLIINTNVFVNWAKGMPVFYAWISTPLLQGYFLAYMFAGWPS